MPTFVPFLRDGRPQDVDDAPCRPAPSALARPSCDLRQSANTFPPPLKPDGSPPVTVPES